MINERDSHEILGCGNRDELGVLLSRDCMGRVPRTRRMLDGVSAPVTGVLDAGLGSDAPVIGRGPQTRAWTLPRRVLQIVSIPIDQ